MQQVKALPAIERMAFYGLFVVVSAHLVDALYFILSLVDSVDSSVQSLLYD